MNSAVKKRIVENVQKYRMDKWVDREIQTNTFFGSYKKAKRHFINFQKNGCDAVELKNFDELNTVAKSDMRLIWNY